MSLGDDKKGGAMAFDARAARSNSVPTCVILSQRCASVAMLGCVWRSRPGAADPLPPRLRPLVLLAEVKDAVVAELNAARDHQRLRRAAFLDMARVA
jgi:hypothetical protein